MDDDVKRQQIREFLAELEPSERERLIECFRLQLGLPASEWRASLALTDGLSKCTPGAAVQTNAG